VPLCPFFALASYHPLRLPIFKLCYFLFLYPVIVQQKSRPDLYQLRVAFKLVYDFLLGLALLKAL
jgi:hypothetical protein